MAPTPCPSPGSGSRSLSDADLPGEGRLPKEARGGSAAPCLLRPSSPSPLSRKRVGNRDKRSPKGVLREGGQGGRPPHPPAPHLQCAAGAGVRFGAGVAPAGRRVSRPERGEAEGYKARMARHRAIGSQRCLNMALCDSFTTLVGAARAKRRGRTSQTQPGTQPEGGGLLKAARPSRAGPRGQEPTRASGASGGRPFHVRGGGLGRKTALPKVGLWT